MRREELLHVARAAADVAGVRRVLILGSQAIHGSYADDELPDEAVRSIEADVVILDDPHGDAASRVDGAIGFMSPFARQFTYYADGMMLEETTLPAGWEGRIVRLETLDVQSRPIDVLFPEVHDLVVVKLNADRPHDRRFVQALWDAGLLDGEVLLERVAGMTDVPGPKRERLANLVGSLRAGRSITTRG